jgi:16S rRNA (guanine527-N7)-methyltransferase
MELALQRRLEQHSAALGVPLSPEVIAGLSRYLDLLLFWNKRINLTSVRDPADAVDRHFIDSLAAVPHVPATARSLVDVGSGAGFPGAIIALVRPTLAVTLIESIHKKTAFLEAVRRELPLRNVTVVSKRIEDWSPPVRPDVAISRATWDLTEWLTRGASLIAPGGCVLGMEAAAQHELPEGATRHAYPHPSGQRAIVVYEPVPRGTS